MKKKSFTLVEILVVMSILLILLTLVLPNIWRGRVNTNESIAVSNLNTLNSALQMYYINNDTFPDNLSDLIPPASSPAYVDTDLVNDPEGGYNFSYNYQGPDDFSITASPRRVGKTGNRYFYIDDSGIVHYSDEGQASSSDPVLK